MPLSKTDYLNAQKRANERLTGWITDVKQDQEFGIVRLQKEFKHAFKKYEWKPNEMKRKNIAPLTKQHNDESDIEEEDQTPEKDSRCFMKTRPNSLLPAFYLEDHQIHDSNSSNLSSRLEGDREEIKLSERRTPYSKTPFSQVDADDTFDIKSEQKRSGVLQNQWAKQSRKRREGIILTQPHQMQQLQLFRKRKRRAPKPRPSAFRPVDVTVDKTDEGPLQSTDSRTEAGRKRSMGAVSSAVSALAAQRSSVFKPTTKGGPLELVMKRLHKSHKPLKAVHSKAEVPVMKEEKTTEMARQDILDRFRRLVRLLIHVRVLLNVSRIRIQEEEKTKGFKRFEGGLELSFDPSMYKTALSYGGLTSRARKALMKAPDDRNEEDARIMMEVMMRLPVFLMYPKAVKQDLAKKMWYDAFQNGRVIMKQGDPGTRMYFIVSGEVDLKRTDITPAGEAISYNIRTMKEGSTFGELALIRDMRRDFTAICKGNAELLSLSKNEFNQALRARWERDCNIRFHFLRSCDYFSSWTDKQLQICADNSELKEYTDNSVIVGDIDGPSENVYFIRKGRCNVVRRVLVVRHQSPYLRPNILLPYTADRRPNFLDKQYCRNRRINQPEIRFLTVTSLNPGAYFGVGENLLDTFILSRGKTECLVINAAQFSIQGKSEQLRCLTRDREMALPNNTTLYNKFQVNRRWHEYRNHLIQEIINRKPNQRKCSLQDVPRSITKEPTIPKDLIFFNKYA